MAPTVDTQFTGLLTQLITSAAGTTDPTMRRLIRDTERMITDLRTGPSLAAQLEADRIAHGGVPSNPNAALPACAGFVGTGQRCTKCRTHKKLHG